jgi:hypothetical protein
MRSASVVVGAHPAAPCTSFARTGQSTWPNDRRFITGKSRYPIAFTTLGDGLEAVFRKRPKVNRQRGSASIVVGFRRTLQFVVATTHTIWLLNASYKLTVLKSRLAAFPKSARVSSSRDRQARNLHHA